MLIVIHSVYSFDSLPVI